MASDDNSNAVLSSSVWSDWESFDIGYNPQGSTEKQKWSYLTSGAYSFSITADNNNYTISLYYNPVAQWVGIKVYDSNQNCLQQWTYLSKFPTNMLLAPELKEYGLFWVENFNLLFFGKLPKGWYNGNINYDSMLEYIQKYRIIESGD